MFLTSSLSCLLHTQHHIIIIDTNFAMKAGPRAFESAEKEGIAIVMPDTSPRGDGVPNVDSYDLGVGAGFYIDATQEPYSKNYNMYTYITEELPALLESEFAIGKDGMRSISGHSMGGHGALTIALKDPSGWASVSAFSPICNRKYRYVCVILSSTLMHIISFTIHTHSLTQIATKCPWGDKAFKAYFGSEEEGKAHDATELLQSATFDDILIDQGKEDEFLTQNQLLPQNLVDSASKCGQNVTLNMREGYDHSYYFIASFIENHVTYHGSHLRKKQAEVLALASVVSDASSTAGKPIQCKAMVARGPKQPLTSETITVDPPKEREVRVKVIANALCHTE